MMVKTLRIALIFLCGIGARPFGAYSWQFWALWIGAVFVGTFSASFTLRKEEE